MNKKILLRLIFGATLLLLAACSKDEATDPNALPDGQYPLQIASVTMSVESSEQPWSANAPQTRVAENEGGTASVWEAGDKIKIVVSGNGNDMTTVGTLDKNGNITSYEPKVFWKNTKEATITAYYPADITEKPLDISNQEDGLKYVMKSTPMVASYNSTVTLAFSHLLAKLRVMTRGTYDNGNTTISVTAPTLCTISQGNAESSESGTITMYKTSCYGIGTCWEANVPANTTINTFTISDNGTLITGINTTDISTMAARISTAKLIVHESGTEVIDLSEQNETYTITDASKPYYFMQSRSSYANNYGIKVNADNAKVYLDGVNIGVSSGSGIEVAKTATIHVQSNSQITAFFGAGISVVENATVTITSAERNSNKLTAKGGDAGAGIGGYSSSCGNIYIKNVTVNAYGSNDSEPIVFSPGIGGSREYKCGFITIDNAIVYAYGTESIQRSGAAIGAGIGVNTLGTYSDITIKNNSEVNVYRGNQYSNYIGHSGAATILDVTTPEIDATVDESSEVVRLN